MTRWYCLSTIEEGNSVQHWNFRCIAPPSLCVSTTFSQISEKCCLFLTEAVCLHCVLQYVLPHLKEPCAYLDTVNHYLNSAQSPSAYCSLRIGTVGHGQVMCGLNQSLWQSDGGSLSHILRWCPFSALNWCTVYCQRLRLCPHGFPAKLQWLSNQSKSHNDTWIIIDSTKCFPVFWLSDIWTCFHWYFCSSGQNLCQFHICVVKRYPTRRHSTKLCCQNLLFWW